MGSWGAGGNYYPIEILFFDSIFDLIDPQYKGQVAIANPLFGTTSFHFAAWFSMLGILPDPILGNSGSMHCSPIRMLPGLHPCFLSYFPPRSLNGCGVLLSYILPDLLDLISAINCTPLCLKMATVALSSSRETNVIIA